MFKKKKKCVIWLTGLPCSGKSTIAENLKQKIKRPTEILDGDVVRNSLCKDLGFSKEDRKTNLKRITFVARMLSKHYIVTICSFVSPYKNIRNKIREEIENSGIEFVEVSVYALLSTCEKRDVKGMYKLAREGKIKEFTGVGAPYEYANNPEVKVLTDAETIEESTNKILKYLKKKDII